MPHLHHTTPRTDGFYMPAEWIPHCRTWMLWPQRPDNWRLAGLPAQEAFSSVARTIARFEPVVMGINPDQLVPASRIQSESIQLLEIANNDAWMRDCGPTFIINGRGDVRIVAWQFNAWGGLYTDWSLDAEIAQKIAGIEGMSYYCAPIILEGGSIHVDGEGTLLTTEECLLNENRNPGLNRPQIEETLKEYTGAAKVLWLGAGVYNDETDGHVDNLACFLRPGQVALSWTDDHNDPQYPISKDAFDRLSRYTDAKGRSLEILKILQPDPVLITAEEAAGVLPVEGTFPRHTGDRMAASYINFYTCNGGIILPAFNDPHDRLAMEVLTGTVPDRQIIPVPAREILLGGGNIHCITQQQPRG